MTAIGVTRPGVAYGEWKLRSERLVRASGNSYTIVRPGWFDYNEPDQRKIVLLQGDKQQSGTPADGVIARDEIARVPRPSTGLKTQWHFRLTGSPRCFITIWPP